jgi:DNA-binding transcriptional MerR regulator
MFKIGDFSRVARVSCRLLRYYDELGLLKPAEVERGSGYRYYSASQLPRLNRILVLRDLGLSLEEIAGIIDSNVGAAQLRDLLTKRRTQVEEAVAAESARLRQIESRIAQIDTENDLAVDDVVIRPEPAHRILTARKVVASFATARAQLQTVSQFVRGQLTRDSIGPLLAIAHAPEFEPDSIDVEFGFILQDGDPAGLRLPDGAALTVRDLPAVAQMASCVRVGLPELAHLITGKIGRYVEAMGYQFAGPGREVFLQPPRFDRMEESVVEMQFPIERAGAGAPL